jgi:hypothetical protein
MSGGLLVWVITGDSITGCASVGVAWPFQYLSVASRGDCSAPLTQSVNYSTGNITAQNMACSGARLNSGGANDLVTVIAPIVDLIPSNKSVVGFGGSTPVRSRKYLLSCSIGTNDGGIDSSATPAIYAGLVAAFCAARKAAGYDLAMMTTLLPRGDGVMTEPNRLAYNSTLTGAGWAAANGIDYIVDFASDSIMGNPANLPVNNGGITTYFNSDNIHPTTVGQARLVPILAPVMNQILATL